MCSSELDSLVDVYAVYANPRRGFLFSQTLSSSSYLIHSKPVLKDLRASSRVTKFHLPTPAWLSFKSGA